MTTFSTQGTHGALHLMTETDAATAAVRRTVRLEAALDGKSVLLIDVDTRKPGIQRAVRYEITPAELIAAIRAHGAELPGEHHADGADRG
jgi:Mrp family chromosome partitioning ATPase